MRLGGAKKMKMAAAVVLFSCGIFLVLDNKAHADVCPHVCKKVMVTFAANPLIEADKGLVPYITTNMVHGGDEPCTVYNMQGFDLETAETTFQMGGVSYAHIIFFEPETGSETKLTFNEVEQVVADICSAMTP